MRGMTLAIIGLGILQLADLYERLKVKGYPTKVHFVLYLFAAAFVVGVIFGK